MQRLTTDLDVGFRLDRFRAIMDKIRAHPERWWQGDWHGYRAKDGSLYTRTYCDVFPRLKEECGTTHCVAGWAQVMAGRPEDNGAACEDGAEWLGIPARRNFRYLDEALRFATWDAPWLFSAARTLADLEAVERGEVEPLHGARLK